MREILFKAKSISNGEWVKGAYLHQTDYYGEKCDKHYIIDGTETDMEGYGEHYLVDENTICQYTGLTDKNGNKIWENDIVTHTYTTYKDDESSYPPFRSEKKQKNYVIKWDNTASFMGYRYHNGRNIFPFKKGTVINGDDEVIGNIFDNPELIGGDE